ncbi:hypothetical protein KKE06_02305 [Candidatus Micrarchaeota archaeon]|nr:hypothetical protein [Candidatus Micrarchaeota archaeon]MBU1930680.1 hypothetical protein [Candidatus Micrarchaeota archaeon]
MFSHELETAIHAARAAGEIQVKNIGNPLEKTMKGVKDFVTQVDIACEKKILSILQKEFPNHGFLMEESREIKSDSDYRWIIDPLDGTLPYARGLSFSGVLIALQKKQELELGVIHRPFQNQLVYAQKNKGCYYDKKKAHVSNKTRLEESHLACSGVTFAINQYPQGFKKLLNLVHWRTTLPWLESVVQVCQGNADLVTGGPGKLWDLAAPKIIIEEAGGIFSDYQGNTKLEEIKGFIASNGKVHEQFVQTIKWKEGVHP